jgi:hypothetical protein
LRFERKRWKERFPVETVTTEMMCGVTLETICPSELPDTESLLSELGTVYPVVAYSGPDLSSGDGEAGESEPVASEDEHRDLVDASIMAGLLWP